MPSNADPRTALHALKSLNTIADSICLSPPEQEDNEAGLTTLLYTHQHLFSVCALLQRDPSSPLVQQQVALAASLISKTCQKEQQRVMAAQAGILEALAAAAASSISDTLRYPPHTKTKSSLAPILRAVQFVVADAKSRGVHFLDAPALALALSKLEQAIKNKHEGSKWDSGDLKGSHAHQCSIKVIESLLPPIPSAHTRQTPNPQHGCPPFGRIGMSDRQNQGSTSLSTAIEINQNQGLEYVGEEESPLIPILVHIFRSSDDTTSLVAAGLLVTLHRLGLTKRPKEPIFAFLLVPSLVRMLDKDPKSTHAHDNGSPKSSENIIMEEAPEILATLMNGCVETQNAAFDAGAIRKLSQLLKESFDPFPMSASMRMWNSESLPSNQSLIREDASRLGPAGVSLSTRHLLKLRESVLAALAAIASEKDEYRKAVIENGVVPFVIKTLRAEPVEVKLSASDGHVDKILTAQPDSTWNHRDVILAACGAARALSRSVSTLRTSLMDAGLPAPLFALLRSQDLEIQIAATGVLCNLVLKFSPMRDVSSPRNPSTKRDG